MFSALQLMSGLMINLGTDKTGEYAWITNEGRDGFLNRMSNLANNF